MLTLIKVCTGGVKTLGWRVEFSSCRPRIYIVAFSQLVPNWVLGLNFYNFYPGRINVVCCVGSVEIYKSKYKNVGALPI